VDGANRVDMDSEIIPSFSANGFAFGINQFGAEGDFNAMGH
jgi:hypothetical protein